MYYLTTAAVFGYLTFLNSIAAQIACLTLDENSVCGPSFKGAPVPQIYFESVPAFNAYMRKTFMDPEHASESISSGTNCSVTASAARNRLQYQLSFWCSKIASDTVKLGCAYGGSPSTLRLCASQCNQATESIKSLLGANACTTPHANPEAVINGFTQLCTNATTSECYQGANDDVSVCGKSF